MPSGRKDIAKDGKATRFTSENQPENPGLPLSIRTQLKEILRQEGSIKIPSEQVIRIDDDGSVVITAPTQMQIAMKLSSWALGKGGSNSLKAIQMIVEHIDGKPNQTIIQTSNDVKPIVTRRIEPKKEND